jgi:peptide/nickel transport system permease protein
MTEAKFLSLVNYAKRTLREGDHAQAKKTAQMLVARYPEAVEGWLLLAGLSSPQKSVFYLNKAREIAPDDPRVKAAMAWADQPFEEHPFNRSLERGQENKGHRQSRHPTRSPQQDSTLSPQKPEKESWIKIASQHGLVRAFVHLAKKGALIGLMIFVGIFLTIIIMNRPLTTGFVTVPPQLDTAIEDHIDRTVTQFIRESPSLRNLSWPERESKIEDFRSALVAESGLELPYLQRHFVWTINALRLDWGRLSIGERNPFTTFRITDSFSLDLLIRQYLPNTLLLIGSAYLLLFLLGLPLALWLARNYGKWFDRFFSLLAPLSSIPSWTIGIILIAIFAYELRVLPAGRMVGSLPPDTNWGYIPIVLRHMVLPVSAIFISIFFHLVYSWRTFFVTFSSEDYVELGKAVGLSDRKLQRDYILKPSLAYVITSFSLMFVSFWQMTMALEVVFSWPGLGWLYVVKGLPNIWGESAYPGDLLITLSLVVMFAYLMGSIVLMLDFVYVLVDPRIKLQQKNVSLRLKSKRKNVFKSIRTFFQAKSIKTSASKRLKKADHRWSTMPGQSFQSKPPMVRFLNVIKQITQEIIRYPSAIIGFITIFILIIGSLYAVIFLPYEIIGEEWQRSHLSGSPRVPQLAKPVWTNLFSKTGNFTSLILDSKDGDGAREVIPLTEEMDQTLLTFTFDYVYDQFPSEMRLNLSGDYEDKKPFVSLFWKTPDGREVALKDVIIGTSTAYDIAEGIPARQLMADHPLWEDWYLSSGLSQTPPHYLLFANPSQDQAEVLGGQFQLVVDALTFESDSEIEAELVMLGQVYGLAGTDFYRRDLLVPLLWGMPFALIIGLGGALSTTIISMVFAASGVWFGGWVDNLVQRLIEVNLVMPVLAISVMAYAFLGISIWTILLVYVFLNAFGMPTKNFRAAFLQIKEAPYIEAAKAYGATNIRIIFKYMVPRLIPVLVPQLVILIPAFVFLEATLGFFNIKMIYPTWGTVIYQATMRSGLFPSRYWMLLPIALLILTGFGFSLFGFALERILNPRLLEE